MTWQLSALHADNKWVVTRFNINSPLLYDDATKYRRRMEVYVVDSDFILPGQNAKLVGKEKGGGENTLAENVQVLAAKWKMTASERKDGFVTIALSNDEQVLIKKHSDIAIRKK